MKMALNFVRWLPFPPNNCIQATRSIVVFLILAVPVIAVAKWTGSSVPGFIFGQVWGALMLLSYLDQAKKLKD